MSIKKISDSFFTGINYWGSKSAINMWSDFDAASIERDLQVMQAAGITYLRVFPLWSVFQPLTALYGPKAVWEYGFGEDPLPDTPAGRAGVSEEACQKFKIFCDLAKKYGMKLIVGLITGHMSFRTYNPPAFDGKALLSDPTVIKWQRRFVKYFVSRFQGEGAIAAWDLGNEPINMPGMEGQHPDAFYVWCSVISDAIKACDPTRPVVSGLDKWSIENGPANLKSIGELCDVHTTHPYNIFVTASDPLPTTKPILDLVFKCKLSEGIAGVPTFVQEFGSIGYMNCSQKTEADFYRACLLACLAHGCHGVMWWCAFDQGHLDYAPYRWNTIGSDYGFFDKELREKPIARENRAFQRLLAKLPNGKLPPHTVNGTILIPREESTNRAELELARTAYLLGKRANLDLTFSYILDSIPASPLYIIPSIAKNKSIPKNRLDELLAQVKNGSVLYVCADTGLLRQIPKLTGVEFAYREDISAVKTLCLDGAALPIATKYFYKPEYADAEILGTEGNGEGVFFRHAYGKGFICFLTLPLERYLTEKHGAFFKEDQPAYERVYRTLAKTAGIVRLCDSDNPFIRLTEHPIDEKSFYAVAINYQNTPQTAHLTIPDGYRIHTVHGSDLNHQTLTLRENDGSVFLLERI